MSLSKQKATVCAVRYQKSEIIKTKKQTKER